MDNITPWFISHYDEVLGIIFSFIYLYFSIKQNIWLWPLGIISSAIYIYIFFNAGIYADMGLQVYYVLISIYGWYHWSFGNTKNSTVQKLKVQFTEKRMVIVLIIITLVLFILISQILINFTDSKIPYWDAFTTATSITATWMLAKKYIEHWLIWIVVDFASVGIYFYRELYLTIFLYMVYGTMAIIGYMQWKKDIVQVLNNGRKS
ncbi:MAG: nicotinamide riboside transporter PnuC [Bacteroidota bacterium]